MSKHDLDRRYPALFAPTGSCAKAGSSASLCIRSDPQSLQVAVSPCCIQLLPNAISVVLPCVPGPLLQLLPRCCLPFLPLGHWPSPSKHGSALGILPSLLLRMASVLELQSFLYVTAHRFVRLTGSSYPYTCVSGSRDFYGRAYHGWLPAPCSGYANHPNRAIDGEGTRTPQTRQPCWLLRLPRSSIPVCYPNYAGTESGLGNASTTRHDREPLRTLEALPLG